MISSLEKLGLSKNESLVYLALLSKGHSTAGKISKHTGIHRRNVYDALEKLEKRGLVCRTINGRTNHYEATSPQNLHHMVEEDRKKLIQKEKTTDSLVSTLMKSYNNSLNHKTNISVYKGVKGIRTVLTDIINNGEENRVLGAHLLPKVIESYLDFFHSKRIKMKIKNRLIFSNDFERAKELEKLPHTEVRTMPKKLETSTAINIYGNKVAIISWSEPISIVIEDSNIAEFHKYYFDFLWKTL